jgi:predicted O-methyltransferase YrrM
MKYLFELMDLTDLQVKYELDDINLNKDIYLKYNKQITEIQQLRKKNNYVNKLMSDNNLLFETIKIIFNRYNIDEKDIHGLRCDYINNELNFYVSDYKNNKIIKPSKYNILIQNVLSQPLYNKIKNLNYCDRENFIYNYKITYISLFFDLLNKNGDVIISVFNFCHPNTINILYVLKCLFKQVIIFNATHIYCCSFLDDESLLKKQDIDKMLNEDISIKHKNDLLELLNFIDNNLTEHIETNKLLLHNEIDKYMDIKTLQYFLQIEQAHINPSQQIINNFKLSIIKDYRRIFIENSVIKMHSAIKKQEINIIQEIISKNNLNKCLEVGMAFGTSAVSILMNKNTTLISVDPFQKTQWNSYGLKLIKSFKYDSRHTLITKKSYEALPELLKEHEKTFDFIFIDGFHTFDYTLLDIFYSCLLLKIGGYIIIDDVLHNGVKQCINYINTNYNFLIKKESPNTVAIYEKINEDTREWNYHVNF